MRKYRMLIYAVLQMKSPFHMGSGKSGSPFTDQPILRNIDGVPFISGGSLTGSLSQELSDVQQFTWLGQSQNEDDKPGASRLIMDDAVLLPDQEKSLKWPVEIRHQNSLLRDSLTVKEGSSFNLEVLPKGSSFCFGCRCDLEDEKENSLFLSSIKTFLAKGGQLGGKDTKGLGRWQCETIAYRTLNMTNSTNLCCWLSDLHGFNWNGNFNELKDELGFSIEKLEKIKEVDRWSMKLNVTIDKGLHLSAGSSGLPKKNRADLSQARYWQIDRAGKLTSKAVDFGSTVRGRLRTAMEILLRTYMISFKKQQPSQIKKLIPYSPTKASSSQILNDFFGTGNRPNKGVCKSSWKVEESSWEDTSFSKEDHIRLDEFTQQVIDKAKFDFSPLCQGTTNVIVTLKTQSDTQDWQKVIIYYAGKLLSQNVLPWGGHGSRGYLGATISLDQDGSDDLPEKPGEILQNQIDNILEQTSHTC